MEGPENSGEWRVVSIEGVSGGELHEATLLTAIRIYSDQRLIISVDSLRGTHSPTLHSSFSPHYAYRLGLPDSTNSRS